jgi:hypothetical protein
VLEPSYPIYTLTPIKKHCLKLAKTLVVTPIVLVQHSRTLVIARGGPQRHPEANQI